MNTDMLRIIDGICREKNIEKENVFVDLEQAIISAIRKMEGQIEDVECTIDRITGEIRATVDGEPYDMKALGRIAAQTAKQVMIQRIREAERGSIFDEYVDRKGQIITGTVNRFEGGAMVVSLGRTEGFLPRSEQIPGETHHPGERIRAMILDVREAPHQVKIILSRTHPDLIRRLFELEVPEVGERVIEIKALAREAGYRTKVAVSSIDTRVDAVGACVGVRGSRIKNIVDELGGEKIDIVRWNESSQILIGNALKPAEVQETALCFELNRATVVVAEDQLSLAIGKRGQNVRLAARLTGWDIDILTPAEYNKGLDDMEKCLRTIEGIDDLFFSKLIAVGIVSLMDIEEVGVDPLVQELDMDRELAERVVNVATEQAKRIAAEMEAAKVAAEQEAEAQAEAAGATASEGEGEAPEGAETETLEGADPVAAAEGQTEAPSESQTEETAGPPSVTLTDATDVDAASQVAGALDDTSAVEGPEPDELTAAPRGVLEVAEPAVPDETQVIETESTAAEEAETVETGSSPETLPVETSREDASPVEAQLSRPEGAREAPGPEAREVEPPEPDIQRRNVGPELEGEPAEPPIEASEEADANETGAPDRQEATGVEASATDSEGDSEPTEQASEQAGDNPDDVAATSPRNETST